jgi:hypothetical protein
MEGVEYLIKYQQAIGAYGRIKDRLGGFTQNVKRSEVLNLRINPHL